MRGENEPLDLIEGSVQEIVRPVIVSPSVQLSLMDIPTHVNLRQVDCLFRLMADPPVVASGAVVVYLSELFIFQVTCSLNVESQVTLK